MRVFGVDLRAFQNLETFLTGVLAYPKRTASGLVFVAHHTAYTHGAVQVVLQVGRLGFVIALNKALRQFGKKAFANKFAYGFDEGGTTARLEGLQVAKYFLAQVKQEASQCHFIVDGGGQQWQGNTLSMFLMKMISLSCSFRFSMRAPCPPGRKSSWPFSSRKGLLSGATARVSVWDF